MVPGGGGGTNVSFWFQREAANSPANPGAFGGQKHEGGDPETGETAGAGEAGESQPGRPEGASETTERRRPLHLPGPVTRPVSFQAQEKKKQEQRHLHEENLRINAESVRSKMKRREEEKLLHLRDMEYTKKKLVSLNPNSADTGPVKTGRLRRSERRSTKRSRNA